MGKRFSGDPEILRSEKRRKILPTDVFERRVIEGLRFKENAVDYGAGTGYFTEILAKHFRRVYAVEAEKSMALMLNEEMKKRGIDNVGIIISETPPDLDFQIDFILFSNVLHEVDDIDLFLDWSTNARVVCIIDWMKIETEFGPPLDERIDEREMIGAVERRFRYVKSLKLYPYHYVLVCYNEKDAVNQSYQKPYNCS